MLLLYVQLGKQTWFLVQQIIFNMPNTTVMYVLVFGTQLLYVFLQ